jgi:hypothetical protein
VTFLVGFVCGGVFVLGACCVAWLLEPADPRSEPRRSVGGYSGGKPASEMGPPAKPRR